MVLGDLMNISIDWPYGRGNAKEPRVELDDEICDESVDFMCTELDNGGSCHVDMDPYVLAPGRAADWPHVRNDELHNDLLQIYQRVRDSGLPNIVGCRIPVPSQLNPPAWKSVATGHPEDRYVIDGICFGFPLHYVGPALPRPNRDAHPSAKQFIHHVHRYVDAETKNHAMLGPYDTSPFIQWTNFSPVMTRPKADSSKRRTIIDLSFPEGNNVNAFVFKNRIFGKYYDHRLPTVADTLLQIERMGYRVMLGTIDIERAYRNIPVCPLDLPLLGIRVGGKVFIDAAMPFGARNSSLNMQLIAQFIVRAIQARGISCQMYLDDMVVQLDHNEDFHTRFREIMALYRALGLPISYSKLQLPAEAIVYLGVNIDLPNRMLSIPLKKIRELEQLARWALGQQYITKKATQCLVGKINHISKCVEPARLFMARVLAALRQAEDQDRVSISQMKADLHWLVCFLRKYNGRSMMKSSAPTKVIMADSCLSGGGGTTMTRAYELVYSAPFAAAHHISTLETINCLVAMRTLINSEDRDKTVEIQCDSESAIIALAYGRARDPVLLAVCRAAWYLSACMGLNIVYTHIPGVRMQIPDALSRAHLGPQHRTKANQIIHHFYGHT